MYFIPNNVEVVRFRFWYSAAFISALENFAQFLIHQMHISQPKILKSAHVELRTCLCCVLAAQINIAFTYGSNDHSIPILQLIVTSYTKDGIAPRIAVPSLIN